MEMKTIKFSEEELLFLRQQYTEELANVEKYIIQVREVLKKLGGPARAVKNAETTGEEFILPKKRGPKAKVNSLEPAEPKKRGRKPKVKDIEPGEPKKRGRPRTKPIEPKIPKKRGRPPKVAVIPSEGSSPLPGTTDPIKREIKPGIFWQSKPVKKVKKSVKRRFSKNRRSGRITLVPLRKPLRIKPPVVEEEEETVSLPEPENQPENPIPPSTD